MKNRVRLKIAGLSLFYIFSVVLLFLPSDYFDSGQSICVSVLLFDIQCYACGLTRAIQHLIHFEFQEAFAFNRLVVIVFPLILYLVLLESFKVYKEYRGLSGSNQTK